jgi:signal peptidase I
MPHVPRVTRRTLRIAATVAVAVVALWWFAFFRPGFLGGSTSYVVVSGTSMQPTLHDHDVVVVRRHDRYDVGDVIAYRPPGGEGYVIHRIVGGSAEDGYVTQGDNRETADSWHPAPGDIAGSHVVTVPRLGAVLDWFAQRFVLGLAVGAAVASVYWTFRLHALRTTTATATGPSLPATAPPPEAPAVAEGDTQLPSPAPELRPAPAAVAASQGDQHHHRRRVTVPHDVVASRIRHRFQRATDPETRLRIREVVFELASVFSSTDPDFDTAAFLRACGAHAYGDEAEAQAPAGTYHQR